MISCQWEDSVMNSQISNISETLNRLSRGMHRFATHGSRGVGAVLLILVWFNLGSVLGQDLPSSPVPVAQQPTAPIGPAPSVPVAPGPPVPVGPQTGPYGPVQPGFIPPPPPPGIY